MMFMAMPNLHAQDVQIGGLLLDNTISRLGHEFATQFGQYWREIPDSQGLNVQIKEIVLPRAGTKLSVNLGGKVIYVTYMGRRQTPIKERVEQAILILIDAIAQSQNDQNNPDLASDEW